VWLIDGFNVLHTVLLGGEDRSEWWRAPERSRLLDRVQQLDDPKAEICVVFDGSREAEPGEARERVQVVFADSADEWLVKRVRGAEDPSRIAVVTADRKLAGRCSHAGAVVVAPRDFLGRCGSEEECGGGLILKR
jgi:predicted RNA-binding protein with PIN domain